MRINNKRVNSWVNLVYTLAFLALGVGVFIYFFPLGIINRLLPPFFLMGIGGVLFIVMRWLGHQHFEYDSDGEALNFKTQEVFLSKYFPSMKKSSEFPKKKLLNYKVKGTIRKDLRLTLKSKRTSTGTTMLKYNVTFLNGSERKDLRRSLRKIVDNNKVEEVRSQASQ